MNRYYDPARGRFTSPDPSTANVDSSNPSSWNLYTYALNDPVRFYDINGLGPCDSAEGYPSRVMVNGQCVMVAMFSLMLNGFKGSISVGSSTPPFDAAAAARNLQKAVKSGSVTDCEALAKFAQAAANSTGDGSWAKNSFVSMFGTLTPKALANIVPGIVSSPSFIALNTGQASGYAADYQNTLPDNPTTGWNGDQGHHFAAFFQFGYSYGASAGAVASFGLEYFQGLDSGIMNLGDVRLGEIAAQMGADLKSGKITASGVAQQILNTLCQH